MDDVDPNIDETLIEYELNKMDRMAKTVSVPLSHKRCQLVLNIRTEAQAFCECF